MEFNREIFEELKPLFISKGLTDSKYYAGYGGLEYYKNEGDNIHWIILAFSLKNNAFVQTNSFISFNSVTSILGQFVSIKTDFIEEIVKNYYIKKEWPKLMNDLCALPLKTKADIEIFKSNISEHVDQFILPFFNKIPNLQAVNDEILNKVPQNEYTKYIPGETNFKVLIIMKLCGNPKYEEFKNWAQETYKKALEIDAKKYSTDYQNLHSLIHYLDNEHQTV